MTLLLDYYPLIFFNKIYLVTQRIDHDNPDDFERIFIIDTLSPNKNWKFAVNFQK